MEQVKELMVGVSSLRHVLEGFTIYFFLLGVRDYIHVVDLAKGHIAALKKLKDNCGCKVEFLSYPISFVAYL